jgi:hypothetical protein
MWVMVGGVLDGTGSVRVWPGWCVAGTVAETTHPRRSQQDEGSSEAGTGANQQTGKPMKQQSNPMRAFIGVAYLFLIVAQLLQAFGIARYTPVLRQFWDWYGLALPSQLLYHYHTTGLFWVLPGLTFLIGLDVLRRQKLLFGYATASFVVSGLLTLVVQLWLIGPLFSPFESMIINR